MLVLSDVATQTLKLLAKKGREKKNGLLRYIYLTHAQSCDNVHVQSATEWAASVHTLHMPKAVITFVFIVLRNGLLRYILYTCPKL